VPEPKEVEETIDIENAGNTVELDMMGATLFSVAIRGDGTAEYVLDAKLTRGSTWLEDVDSTYSGAADYDDVVQTGMPKVRVRCTSGTTNPGDTATVTLSAGGG
jgi:hypothetical protein